MKEYLLIAYLSSIIVVAIIIIWYLLQHIINRRDLEITTIGKEYFFLLFMICLFIAPLFIIIIFINVIVQKLSK